MQILERPDLYMNLALKLEQHRLKGIIISLPGMLLFTILWYTTYIKIDFRESVESSYGLWQSLGKDLLISDPLNSINVLHIQPPGFNALQALDLYITPTRHLLMALALLFMMNATIFFIVDLLIICNINFKMATFSGLFFAILPTSIVYSLWPMTTGPTIFGSALTLWGIARSFKNQIIGIMSSSIGVIFLVMMRATFSWIFACFWVINLIFLVYFFRRKLRILIVQTLSLLITLVIIFLIQAHYFVSFGLPTMTSWSGENLAKKLVSTNSLVVTNEARLKIAKDPCKLTLLNSLVNANDNSSNVFDATAIWHPIRFREYPSCSKINKPEVIGNPAWDSPEKDGKFIGGYTGNFNWSERLIESRIWNQIMTEIILNHPTQLVSGVISSEFGPKSSSLGIYLGPAEDYPPVLGIAKHNPLGVLGGLFSLFFTPITLFLGFVGFFKILHKAKSISKCKVTVFIFGSFFAFYHILVSTIFEYGENMRYAAEISPVLLILGILSFHEIKNDLNIKLTTANDSVD